MKVGAVQDSPTKCKCPRLRRCQRRQVSTRGSRHKEYCCRGRAARRQGRCHTFNIGCVSIAGEKTLRPIRMSERRKFRIAPKRSYWINHSNGSKRTRIARRWSQRSEERRVGKEERAERGAGHRRK